MTTTHNPDAVTAETIEALTERSRKARAEVARAPFSPFADALRERITVEMNLVAYRIHGGMLQ